MARWSRPEGDSEGPRKVPASIFWILLLALALRAIACRGIDPVTFDSAVYFEMASLMQAGRWSDALAYPYPPLYPLLVACFSWLPVTAEITKSVRPFEAQNCSTRSRFGAASGRSALLPTTI